MSKQHRLRLEMVMTLSEEERLALDELLAITDTTLPVALNEADIFRALIYAAFMLHTVNADIFTALCVRSIYRVAEEKNGKT